MATATGPAANAETSSKPVVSQRECVVCCESYTEAEAPTHLIRPCRQCPSDYCHGCLRGMFTTTDPTRMPPRCCTILHLHTVVKQLDTSEIARYKERFEEWMTVDKTYCPSPSCSALIPTRHLPKDKPKTPPTPKPTTTTLLNAIMKKVTDAPSARFFGDAQTSSLPNYVKIIGRPMTIDVVNRRLNLRMYDSIEKLKNDFRLIRDNAKTYHGSSHPVTKTSHELLEDFDKATSASVNEMVKGLDKLVSNQSLQHFFACPTCHIAICSSCKQIEHGDAPCDATASDHETAMLAQFGYKRCPRCKHGVRKMYGCPHMQCHCGAHWCWTCGESTDICGGGCGEDESEDENDYDEYDSDEEGSMDEDEDEHEVNPQEVSSEAPTTMPGGDAKSEESATNQGTIPKESDSPIRHPVNLDGGGAARWAHGHQDFGDEPDEEPYRQIWSCTHDFGPFKPEIDEHDRGDLTRVECNRCFKNVVPAPTPAGRIRRTYAAVVAGSGKRKRVVPNPNQGSMGAAAEVDASGKEKEKALECNLCYLLVCPKCKEEYSEPAATLEVRKPRSR